ncbi:serine/threonine-protein kinase pim-1-like [Diretmus argenteus]
MAFKSVRKFASLPSPRRMRDLGSYTRRTVSEGPTRPTRTRTQEDDGPERRGLKRKSKSSDQNDQPPAKRSSTQTSSQVGFEAKYCQQELLGEGSFGAVYAGYRREDNLPVAIKLLPIQGLKYTEMDLDGETSQIPLEVVLMLRVADAESLGKNAAVSLLDWYQQDQKLILVMERPIPCMDLFDYAEERGTLQEDETKILMKQLLSGILDIHAKGVLHRDIKLENLLIETGSPTPRLRLIDFGCGTFLHPGFYDKFSGTDIPPEWYEHGLYRGGESTVWQLGMLIYSLVSGSAAFNNEEEIRRCKPVIDKELSQHCQDLLRSCLAKDPQDRPTLESLLLHPWLQ